MVRLFLLALLGSASAARLDLSSMAELNSDAMMMVETLGLANGILRQNVDALQPDLAMVCPEWAPQLAERFHSANLVGSGASACVWIATDSTNGKKVAVKLAKLAGMQDLWTHECESMQALRAEACAKGQKFQELAEMYMPTCAGIGSVNGLAYLAMQAAGATGIQDAIPSLQGNPDAQINAFVQLVAGVYALHGIGYTHNDLHGHNIVVDGPELALIDFSEVKHHHRGLSYKHDANSVWRWAAEIAGCPENARYPLDMKNFFAAASREELRDRSQNMFQCLRENWGVDEDFIAAFEVVVTHAIAIHSEQHMEELFETNFVQSHLPQHKVIYPWYGSSRCAVTGEVNPNDLPPRRLTTGDRVMDLLSYRCGTIVKDDESDSPYTLEYNSGEIGARTFRAVQLGFSPKCLEPFFRRLDDTHCGGKTITHWEDGSISDYGRHQGADGGSYTDLDTCKQVCAAHPECTNFMVKDSNGRCSNWKAGHRPHSSPYTHCYVKHVPTLR